MKLVGHLFEQFFGVLLPGLLLATFFSKTPQIGLALLVGSWAVLSLLYDIKHELRALREENKQ